MRKRKSFIIFLLMMGTISVFGQNETFVGFQGSFAFDQFSFNDPGNVLENPRLLTGSLGVLISQQFNDYLMLETGYTEKDYVEGYQLTAIGDQATIGSSMHVSQIPLRMITRINIFKEKFFLLSRAGGSININNSYFKSGYAGGMSGTERFDGKMLSYNGYVTSLREIFFLAEAGIGLETKLFKDAYLSFSGSYYAGVKRVLHIDYIYNIDNGADQLAYNSSDGSYWNFELAFKYSITRFFKKD